MSKLAHYGRPWVVFDINNEEHRSHFNEYNRTKSWGKCPVRFVLDGEHANIIAQITEQVVNYYLAREFGQKKVDKLLKIV